MVQSNFTNPFAEMFKMFSENNLTGKVPGLDFNQLIDIQRSNAQTISSVNQIMTENMQNMIKRQSDVLHSGANEAMNLVKDFSSSPEMTMQKSASFVKNNVEAANSNIREMMDITVKSTLEVFDIISERIKENMEIATPFAAKRKA